MGKTPRVKNTKTVQNVSNVPASIRQKVINESNSEDSEYEPSVNEYNGNQSNNNGSIASGNFEEGYYTFPFSPEVASNFEEIVKLRDGETEDIIKYLKSKYADGLPTVSIPNVNVPTNVTLPVFNTTKIYPISDIIHRYSLKPVFFEDNGNNWRFNNIPLIKIGSGTYGSIFQDPATGLVYKQTLLELEEGNDLEVKCEDFYREFLLEAFIQIVLQTDNASAVGKITDIYIDDRIHRMSLRNTNSPHGTLVKDIHPRLPNKSEYNMIYSFFYEMSKIPYTFESYADKFGETTLFIKGMPKKVISLNQLQRILIKLANNLKGFQERYGFKHRDLHPGNVMFDEDGNPILIDFGMSCLKMGDDIDNIYSVKKDGCDSFDLLLLIAGLYQSYGDLFDSNAYNAIGDCMKITQTDNKSVYDIIRVTGIKHVFHAFYYYKFKNNPKLIRKIPPRLRNDIESFISFWETYKPLSIARRFIGCIGAACGRGAAAANSNSNTRRRKLRKSNRRNTRK